jgi:predicted RNA-binding Zn-ribbon protein involved in translation (DUF1610 family)
MTRDVLDQHISEARRQLSLMKELAEYAIKFIDTHGGEVIPASIASLLTERAINVTREIGTINGACLSEQFKLAYHDKAKVYVCPRCGNDMSIGLQCPTCGYIGDE